MMVKSGAKIDGLDDLLKNFRALHDDLKFKAAAAAVAGGARLVANEAKKNAQQQGLEFSGALLENIAIKRNKTGPDKIQYNVGVRHGSKAKRAREIVRYRGTKKKVRYENDPFYWWFHEFGTSKMPARPFMRPAFEANVENVKQAMTKRLRSSIERFKRKYGRKTVRST